MTTKIVICLALLFLPQPAPAPSPLSCARPAVLVRVVDGDTWILDIDLGYDVHTHVSIREEGLFAPELRTPEGDAAKIAAERKFEACKGQIAVQSTGHRSFARWVGRTYLCGQRFVERP